MKDFILDIDSITNSAMMAMEKESRKNGIAPEFHDHFRGNREIVKGMVAIMVAEAKAARERKANGS